jgi:hypothetical protein
MMDAALRESFRYGQALAAWNRGYEGARDGMYATDHPTFVRQVQKILEGQGDLNDSLLTPPADRGPSMGDICPACVRTVVSRSATGTTDTNR